MEFKEKFEINVRCPKCGKYHSVFVEKTDFYKWCRSKYSVKEIFSYLTVPEQEIINSGICPACWNNKIKDTA